MIVVRLIGGLGNQLFQYATARAISERLQTEVKLDISAYGEYKLHKYALNYFNIVENIATQKDLLDLSAKEELHFHFDKNVGKYSDNLYIKGYWQTEKYFSEISEILQQEVSVSSDLSGKDQEVATQILKKNSVSLHVRRGDYVKQTYDDDQILDSCDLEYYKKAVECISSKVDTPHFFIFSDDHKWVRENLILEYPVTFVDHNSALKHYQDLRLMSLCEHNIIANSSFSWWGAWLNKNPDKVVCAPRYWFSANAHNLNSKDIVPDLWIQI